MNNDDRIKDLPAADLAKLINLAPGKREAALAVMLAKLDRLAGASSAAPVVAPVPVKVASEAVERVVAVSVERRPLKPVDAPSDENRAVFSVLPIEWGNDWRQPCASLSSVLVDRPVRGKRMLNTGVELRLDVADRW